MGTPEIPTLIFIGQPNCGKSTLFNSIAGLKAETSNFPGTTSSTCRGLIPYAPPTRRKRPPSPIFSPNGPT